MGISQVLFGEILMKRQLRHDDSEKKSFMNQYNSRSFIAIWRREEEETATSDTPVYLSNKGASG